jgi:hypothetical protein
MPQHCYRLTDRDVAILTSLAAVRCLTVEHVQWLHWQPEWRTAAKIAREAGKVHYGPKNAYRRVRALALVGYVRAISRTIERGISRFQRLPLAYTLTRAGAVLLASERGDPVVPPVAEPREQSVLTLEHQVAIGSFYAALHAEAAYRGRALTGWQDDHALSTSYDTVVVPSQHRPLPVLPDATFALDGVRYLVELDRGTTSTERWQRKALAYRAYAGSGSLIARYGVPDVVVLVVAPTTARLHAIARAVAAIDPMAVTRYRFLEAQRVYPTTIRRKWQQIATVMQAPEGPVQVTLREVALWMPTSAEVP